MTADRDLAISDIDGISRQQPQQPLKLVQQVRAGHRGGGIDWSINGSLKGKPVRVELLHTYTHTTKGLSEQSTIQICRCIAYPCNAN